MAEPRPMALVVDDEPSMRHIVTFALQTQDFDTCEAGSAEAAWTVLQRQHVDLVVLDVMLPGASGVELCRRIATTSGTPVILLTALGETSKRIEGLEAGAADYIAKPFHPRELALRAAGLVRRRPRGDSELTVGSLVVSLPLATAYVAGERLALTTHEFTLLAAFAREPGTPIPFGTLLLLGWGDAQAPGGKDLLKTAIYRMRLKLEALDPELAGRLRSIRGVGYQLDPPPRVPELR